MNRSATLYLHFPCFDGVISAVLTLEFLECQGWKFRRFCPVTYELRANWLSTKLKKPCAVVDFLYHPDAQFWADHHSTTFLAEDLRREFSNQRRAWMFYDSRIGSCALLLWKNISNYVHTERARYQEMVDWAEKIDSARYASVREAILGDAPALRINFSLMRRADTDYCAFLIRALRKKTLALVAELPEVGNRFEEARSLIEAGLNRFRESARMVDGDIVVFDIEAKGNDIISRYAPFYFFPEARYSIGIVRRASGAKITAMRNPWREFHSVPLGVIFGRYGGGGHQRVGAVILEKEHSLEAQDILAKLISEIRRQELTIPITAQGGV